MHRFALLLLVACSSHFADDDFGPDAGSNYQCGGTVPVTTTTDVGLQPTGIIHADDIDGDVGALLVANTGSSSISILHYLYAPDYNYSVRELPTGVAPVAIFAADFNGDYTTDIAVVNSGDDTVSIFLNTSSVYASPSTFGPATVIPVGHHPTAIAPVYHPPTYSINLVVANRDDNSITVLVNDHGSFTAGAPIPVGAKPVALAVAPFTSDSTHRDIAVVNQDDNTFGVLLNSGDDATFGAMTPFATGTGPSAIAVNSFKFPSDVWVTNETSKDMSYFAAQGPAQFASPVTTSTIGTPRAIAYQENYMMVADYDAGVVRHLAQGNTDVDVVGTHPTSLYSDDEGNIAVTNGDDSSVTAHAYHCVNP